jgi:hypothetical protein
MIQEPLIKNKMQELQINLSLEWIKINFLYLKITVWYNRMKNGQPYVAIGEEETFPIEINLVILGEYHSVRKTVSKPHNDKSLSRNCCFMEQNLEWLNLEYIENEELEYLLGMVRSRTRGAPIHPIPARRNNKEFWLVFYDQKEHAEYKYFSKWK